MHRVVDKAYMEKKFKPLIEEGTPTTTLKKIKDKEDIPKYRFKFCNKYVLKKNINVDMNISGTIASPLYLTRAKFGLTKRHDIVLLIQ
ncbi:hypothetical protein BS78_K280500 [Paspalum vaginatum]|uniref:Uncharacterized protein n=1 Tax=Paspalum vaginatum TaxID=158149 RepID=A0A9W8CDW5_9POAL|nr:hypothetical protein BS78_K280500 [Paspalum vaginatum]